MKLKNIHILWIATTRTTLTVSLFPWHRIGIQDDEISWTLYLGPIIYRRWRV